MRLVFVHGRDQQGKDPVALCRAWKEALDVGLEKAHLPSVAQFHVEFPFYGDLLSDMVVALKKTEVPEGLRTKGGSGSLGAETEAAQNALLEEILASDDALPSANEVVTKGLQNTRAALMLARYADDSKFGKELLRQFTEDVALYLTNYAVAKEVDQVVRDAIGTAPCVVVAHSLGSVVAYRVLRAMGSHANVAKLITVGSPLGLKTICSLLRPPALQRPLGVKSWVNAYDRRDLVSLHPLDQSTWPIQPQIVNLGNVDNHTDNRHGIGGYLDDADVAKVVFEGLNANPSV